ncbi:hypothetical protein PORY_002503 [Pneumocystis oryctolagi]|uniref:Uncharacterized protein n=1 Tax=Pneumocystis oryctolagi TaxID=42067 RepID=A0ACB7CBE4_9ASCO|nr:hypothetical protein PORY_002503 [Pneumocystis oryctolagi]
MFSKLTILWFYIIPFVLTQSCNEDIHVKTQADINRISNCIILTGNFYITSPIPTIFLENLKEIDGDLIVSGNDGIFEFKAPMLTSVSGKVEFSSLTALDVIELPSLNSVNDLVLLQCARLQKLDLNSGIRTISTLRISDTSLRLINGFYMKTLISLDIDNNKYLTDFYMPNLTEVRGPLIFIQNGYVQYRNGFSVSFPSLKSTGDLTLQSVSKVDLDNLRSVFGHLVITLTTISKLCLEKLEVISESFSIYNNSDLTELYLPKLNSIGGTFLLSGNPRLNSISGFPQVRSIGGSLSWSGAFTNISLPNINDIRGTVKIISTSALVCPQFTKSKAIVQGANPICRSSADSETGRASSNRKGGSSNRKSGSVKFIGGLNIVSIIEIVCIFAVFHLII